MRLAQSFLYTLLAAFVWGATALTACGDSAGDDDDTASDTEGETGGTTGGTAGPGNGDGDDDDNGTGAPDAVAINAASLPNYNTENNDKFFAGVAGTHAVAIYRMPEGREAEVGPGTLTIEGSASAFKASLKNWKGEVVSSFDSATAKNVMLTPVIGQVFGFATPEIDGYLNIAIKSDGFISGAAGGFAQVAFRNLITSYGAKVPALFAAIAGTYTGPAEALTCGQPPVTVTITAAGKVTIAGQYNLSCGEATVEATWDGNDEFQAPYVNEFSTDKVEIQLDTRKGGGSQEGGGITLRTDVDGSAAKLTYVVTVGNGSVGNLAAAAGQLVKP